MSLDRRAWLGALLLPAAVSACVADGAPEEPGAPFCITSVAAHSNPEAGARGDFAANVAFADLFIGPNAVAYGATAGRSDEITVADGKLHLARPDGAGGFEERNRFAAGEGAYMVQLVSPTRWRDGVKLDAVADIDALGAAIAGAAAKAGCDGPAKLAYRIIGRVEHVAWSLDALPVRGDFETAGQDAVIVGLYANVDQGAHFVTVGRNIHAHVVFPALGVAGHVKAIRLAPGAVLQLQGG